MFLELFLSPSSLVYLKYPCNLNVIFSGFKLGLWLFQCGVWLMAYRKTLDLQNSTKSCTMGSLEKCTSYFEKNREQPYSPQISVRFLAMLTLMSTITFQGRLFLPTLYIYLPRQCIFFAKVKIQYILLSQILYNF